VLDHHRYHGGHAGHLSGTACVWRDCDNYDATDNYNPSGDNHHCPDVYNSVAHHDDDLSGGRRQRKWVVGVLELLLQFVVRFVVVQWQYRQG